MNVVLLTAHMSRHGGGVWEFTRNLGGSLSRVGVKTAIVGLHDRCSPQADIACFGAPRVSACRVAGPDAFGFSVELLPALHALSPDVVHAQGIWMYPSLASLKWHRCSKRPYIVSPHGMLDPWALGRAPMKKWFASLWYEREHLRSAACLHASSEAEARAIRAHGLANPICIVPYGISLPPAHSGKRPTWAEALEPGTRILLFFGRLHPKKGLIALVRAWRHVHGDAEREGWRLIIAGWDQGGHMRKLSALISDLNLSNSVRLVGPQFDLDKDATLRAADAFILPSLSEGQPVAILEAWSYGLPVLMTPQCNLPEGFAGGAAIKLQPDTNSIAEGLQVLFRMPAKELNEIGRRGRGLIEDRFSCDGTAAQMSSVYAWLAGGGTPPASVTASVRAS